MTEEQTEAQRLLADRVSTYGPRVKNMEDLATLWSVLVGTEIRPYQAALMMAQYKLLRANHTPDYADNMNDVDGYIEMARECIGDDMIEAETVKHYTQILNDRLEDKARYNREQILEQEAVKSFDDIINTPQRPF